MARKRTTHFDVLKIMRLGRLLITIIASGLALFFTWLQLKEISVVPLIQEAKPEFIQKFALIVYYFCWLFGSRADTNSQEAVYVEVPTGWRLTLPSLFLLLIFAVVTAAMLWVAGDEKKFAFLLTVFVLYNIFGWWYLNYMLKPIMRRSRQRLTEDRAYFDLERLNVVMRYLLGRWQWARFGVMIVIIAISDTVTFIPSVRTAFSALISSINAELQAERVYLLLPDLLLLFFVIVAETWIWTMRVRVATALSVLDDLKTKYSVARPRPH